MAESAEEGVEVVPYPPKKERAPYNHAIAELNTILQSYDDKPGHLNYIISRLCWAMAHRPRLCYDSINKVRGVLTNADSEFYRRIAGPYEDIVIERNGDIDC